jgi:hypothetical protein
MQYPCPACGFEVFDEPPGSYDLCPICNWEDDGVQLRFPAMYGGANSESLFEYQRKVLTRFPTHIKSSGEYDRAIDWRPLTEEECREVAGMPESRRDYFESIDVVEPKYYWRREG